MIRLLRKRGNARTDANKKHYMKTYLECIPCFFNQALRASKMLGLDEASQKRIINEIAVELPNFPLTSSPPEMGRFIYAALRKHSGIADPFKNLKEKSNRLALRFFDDMKKRAETADDPLLFSVKLSAVGNVIDYGVPVDFDLEKEILRLIDQDFTILDYKLFIDSLKKAGKILYLADNAGEIVFDKILIEQIKKDYSPDITVAVRGAPIINDATMEDAAFCGLDEVVQVIPNGYDAPGTMLSHCSKEFLNEYQTADLIISKGQGNFESLNDKEKDIFYLFKAKCPCVAKHVDVPLGSLVMINNKKLNEK